MARAAGSLDILLQHDDPGGDRRDDWLPAPRGPLGVTLRLCGPRPEVLDGRWAPPPPTRSWRRRLPAAVLPAPAGRTRVGG